MTDTFMLSLSYWAVLITNVRFLFIDYEIDGINSDDQSPPISGNNTVANAEDSGDDSRPPGASDDSESESESDDNAVTWGEPDPNVVYDPRLRVSTFRQPQLLVKLPDNATELDVFRKFFPRSLILRIVECTNERLDILNDIRKEYNSKQPKKKRRHALIPKTDEGEIQILLGVILTMSYNHLPEFHDY